MLKRVTAASLEASSENAHESIGRAGLLALRPLHLASESDRWLRHLLEVNAKQ